MMYRRCREDELALINALQVRPRASRTELGRALEADPVTVARRFSRLSDQGAAWTPVITGPEHQPARYTAPDSMLFVRARSGPAT
jgi:hypothetical protein